MTRSPEVGQRSGCPELEALAAFVEGRLEGAEQAAVIEHLSDCEACREVVAESRALLAELDPAAAAPQAPARPLEFRPRSSARRIWALAAGLALTSAGLGYFLLAKSPSVDAVMADFAQRGDAARLPSDWTDPRWPVMRGDEPSLADRALAFRLGVRRADLALAIALGDRASIELLANETAATLAGVPFAESIADRYRQIASGAHDSAIDLSVFKASAALAARETREAVDEVTLDFGEWAETERLLASAGSSTGSVPPPEVSSMPDALEELLGAAVEAQRRPDLAAREAAFERLIAYAGDLQ
ncbi:MAG: zf-HC2 domain-containing protein [Thermoanaerobaculia bacterium]|mgnify:CR=1 FL=1|nr:zf-HC2 domain-containing protein [Thermoanaerobaculia bacterium]